jgi:hypothetical protein
MSGLAWARNESDDNASAFGDMSTSFLRAKVAYQNKHGKPPRAVMLSRLTLLSIPLPYSGVDPISTFYGVPIEVANALALWEFKVIDA